MRYQGQYFDEETGLCYNRFRYFDDSTGLYLSQDPIGLDGGMALYAYVHDTNTWIDLFGLSPLLADSPTYSGIYHIVEIGGNNRKYVGSSINIRDRLSADHDKAAEIIKTGNFDITYYQVNLGTATTDSDINHILRLHEQKVFQNAGYVPKTNNVLNSNRPSAEKKMKRNEGEAKTHGADFVGKPVKHSYRNHCKV